MKYFIDAEWNENGNHRREVFITQRKDIENVLKEKKMYEMYNGEQYETVITGCDEFETKAFVKMPYKLIEKKCTDKEYEVLKRFAEEV